MRLEDFGAPKEAVELDRVGGKQGSEGRGSCRDQGDSKVGRGALGL